MRSLLLLAAIVLVSTGCQSVRDNFQFGDNNFGRVNLGGGTRFMIADAIAGGDRHGDHFSGMTGGIRVGTVVYDDENVQADVAAGPQFTGTIGPDKDGTAFGADVDVRMYYKGFSNVDEETKAVTGLQPFVTVGTGVNYMDVDFIEESSGGSSKWGMPLKAGLGVRYLFNERWAASVEYNLHHQTGLADNFFDHGHSSQGTGTDMFLLGVEYKF